jgi:hypothetical protein
MIFIANKRSFYEITDIIPRLLTSWEREGHTGLTDQDAIQALMQKFKCTVIVESDQFDDETARKILAARA